MTTRTTRSRVAATATPSADTTVPSKSSSKKASTTAAAKKTSTKATKAAAAATSSTSTSTSKTAPKRTKKTSTASTSNDDDDDVSLADAAAAKLAVQSESSEEEAESEAELEEEEEEVKPKKKRATPAAKKASKKKSDETESSTTSSPSIPTNPLHTKLGSLFTQAQHSYHVHSSLTSQSHKLLLSNPATFLPSFLSHTAYLCQKGGASATTKKDPGCQRVIEWIGTFVAYAFGANVGASTASSDFSETFLSTLISWSESKDKLFRLRVLQIYSDIMKHMSEECDLPEELFDQIVETLLARCEDKIEAVRHAAILALHRFQTGEQNDPIGLMYVRMMTYDTSASIRKAAIESIATFSTQDAIASLLVRVQDVHTSVRAAAFKSLQTKLHMKQLSIESRARLIRVGLRDRDPLVVKACKSMIDTWFISKNRDILRFLKSMACDTFTEESCMVASYLIKNEELYKLKSKHGDENGAAAFPPYSSAVLTHEHAMYWRVLAETLYSMINAETTKDDEREDLQLYLDTILPDTVELCHLISSQVGQGDEEEEASNDTFLILQLLHLTSLSDMGDEAGRRELSTLCEDMLRDTIHTDQSLIPSLMKLYRLVHTEENDFIRVILELLSDIHNPIDRELTEEQQEMESTYAEIQKNIEAIRVQKQALLNAGNREGAEVLKEQLANLSSKLILVESHLNRAGMSDDSTWARLLSIVCDLLENTQRFKLNHPGLHGLRESLIEPGIQHEHLLIQSLGLKALSLYALLDRDTASVSLPMFLYAANYADTFAQKATAMRGVTDILMLFEELVDVDDVASKKMEEIKEDEEDENAEDENAAEAVADDGIPSTPKLSQIMELFSRQLNAVIASLEEMENGGIVVSPSNGNADEEEESLSPTTPEQIEVYVMAIECLAKLLLYGRIPATRALCEQLFTIYFHSQTDTRIKQCLAVFLPAFKLSHSSNQTEMKVFNEVYEEYEQSAKEEEKRKKKVSVKGKKSSISTTSKGVLEPLSLNTSARGRPSRSAKIQATSRMKADAKKLADMDKIIDAESEESEEEQEAEEEEQENIRVGGRK